MVTLGFILLLGMPAQAQSMAGTYTVGGISPDFATINECVSSLDSLGISDLVTVEIRSGVYEERIELGYIPGSSSQNRLIFTSATGNSEDVIIEQFPDNSTNNYTLLLDSARYIDFEDLSIRSSLPQTFSGNLGRVVAMVNNCHSIRFIGNQIRSWEGPIFTSSTQTSLVHIEGEGDGQRNHDSLSFMSNIFENGSIALYMIGKTFLDVEIAQDLRIEQNSFVEQWYSAIYVRDVAGVRISKNSIANNGNGAIGITANHIRDTLNIAGNLIELGRGLDGLFVVNSGLLGSPHIHVSNNSIYLGTEVYQQSSSGLRFNDNGPASVYYNTVYVNDESGAGRAFFVNHDSLTAINNHFIHSGGGYSYWNTQAIDDYYISEHNNFFNDGSAPLIRIESESYSDLQQYQNDALTFGLMVESGSISEDPNFYDSDPLITYNPDVLDLGISISEVHEDFYGSERDPVSPDMGIFEHGTTINDAGVIATSLDASILCPGSDNQLLVSIRNYSTETLQEVELHYLASTGETGMVSWSGALSSGEEANDIMLGNIVPVNSMMNITLQVWTSQPNGAMDGILYNDTLTLNLGSALTGTYEINEDTGDFISFSQAADALMEYGVCGPVRIEIADGVYTEQLKLGSIEGSSEINTTTFASMSQDSAAVTLVFDYNSGFQNHVVSLNGTDHVYFEHLTFEALDELNNRVIHVENGCGDFGFSLCHFIAPSSSNNYARTLIWLNGVNSHINSVSINGCTFTNGGNQLIVEGQYEDSTSFDIEVEDCVFEGECFSSVQIKRVSDVRFLNNQIIGSRNANVEAAFSFDRISDGLRIDRNAINVSNITVSGLNMNQCTGTESEPILFSNNSIVLAYEGTGAGIRVTNSEHVEILNNSLSMNPISTFTSGYGITLFGIDNILAKNNVISIKEDALMFNLDDGSISELDSDYNIFYSEEELIFKAGNNDYQPFSYWINTLGQDENSLSTNPHYFSEFDLHVDNALSLYQTGVAYPSVTLDLDGEPRNNPPCIGADEFMLDESTLRDLSVSRIYTPMDASCLIGDTVIIEVVNHSAFSIDSFQIKWKLYEVLMDSLSVNDPIGAGDTMLVGMGSYPFNYDTSYDLKGIVERPNGELDHYFLDNTWSVVYEVLGEIDISVRKEKCENTVELSVPYGVWTDALWSNSVDDHRIFVNESGIYSVILTDEAGCSIQSEVEIEIE